MSARPRTAIIAVRVSVPGRDLAPIVGRGRDLDRAAEIIWVGDDQRALFAVDLDRSVPVARRRRSSSSSTRRRRSTNVRTPVTWVATSTGMRGPGERLAADDALGARARGDARDACHRPEQVDEIGDVIGAHVEHRAAAAEIVEGRARVPAFMARAHEEGGSADSAARSSPRRGIGARSGARRRETCPAPSRAARLAALAASTSVAASATVTPSGFSEWTCLPAAIALRPTST